MDPLRSQVNMKAWQIAVVGLLPLAMSGCKSDPGDAG